MTRKPLQKSELFRKFQLILYLTKHFKLKYSTQKTSSWLKITNNRERQTKMIQYPLQFFVYLFFKNQQHEKGSTPHKLSQIAKAFSYTRKTTRLGHSVESLADLQNSIEEFQSLLTNYRKSQQQNKEKQEQDQNHIKNKWDLIICGVENLDNFTCMLNDFFDDMFFLGQLGVLGDKWQKIGERFGGLLWWISICFSITSCSYKVYRSLQKYEDIRDNKSIKDHEKQILTQEKQCIYDLLNLGRFLNDFINCSYDCIDSFDIKTLKKFTEKYPQLQNVAGFLGGVCQR